MKAKTEDLKGAALDWAVAKSKGHADFILDAKRFVEMHETGHYNYSTEWAQGGPIIEREGMNIGMVREYWQAHLSEFDLFVDGPTPLVAAMRCYVASKLGDVVDVPEYLMEVQA